MVQVYRKTHEYPDPPSTTLLAFFLRYPNPFARHVLSVDVLSRRVDPVTGQIHTQRLILKRGILPKWATSWLPLGVGGSGGGLDAWVLEESVVDPPGGGGEGSQPRLMAKQGNLNHRKFMHVVETGRLEAGPSGNTLHYATASVHSSLGGRWSALLRQKIESYGVGKFEVNTESARQGMSLILSRLRDRQPLPDTSEYYPPPPPGFEARWPDPRQPNSSGVGVGDSERARFSGQSGQRGGAGPTSFFLSPGSLARLGTKQPSSTRTISGDGEGSREPDLRHVDTG